MPGSSAGGVVVDRLGRAVAIIVSEYTPMLPIPHTSAVSHESDSSPVLSVVGSGEAAFTKCIRLDLCKGLSDIILLYAYRRGIPRSRAATAAINRYRDMLGQ